MSDADMPTVKTRVAQALSPMLSAFHSITERRLQHVWQMHTEGSLDRLIFDFGSVSLVVTADEDDDSIDFGVAASPDASQVGCVEASHVEPWKGLIGKSFGWGWVTVNQQGYCDGLLLSFEGIVPDVLLNVMASSIKVGLIARVEAVIPPTTR
jgi:hypothetical protein